MPNVSLLLIQLRNRGNGAEEHGETVEMGEYRAPKMPQKTSTTQEDSNDAADVNLVTQPPCFA